jgi:hypothetical protein
MNKRKSGISKSKVKFNSWDREERGKILKEIEEVIIKWHSLENGKWDSRNKKHYNSMDNAVQDLIKRIRRLNDI